jgi:hypothetical protein
MSGGGWRSAGTPDPEERRRFTRIRAGSVISAVVVLALGLAAGLGGALGAKADTVNNQDFCLQGDVNSPGNTSVLTCGSGQKDWSNFFNSSGGSLPLPTGTAGVFTDSNFQHDALLPDTTTYATGSKDTLPIHTGAGWQCGTSKNLGAKVDLQNTYATIERLNSDGHVILYYGAEIASANGDHNQGMWLLQDSSVACDGSNGSKPFSASTVAFEWECNTPSTTGPCAASSPGSLVALNGGNPVGSICNNPSVNTPVDEACAITNESWNVQTPWTPANSPATALGPQQFFEGGIDITEVFGGTAPCFSKFLTDTRSSQSSTATLFDYTLGSLHTCASPTVNTQLKVQAGTSQSSGDSNVTSTGVALGSKVYDTSTLSGSVLGTPGGSVTYKLFANSDCTGTVPSSAINGTTLTNNIVSGPSTVSGTTMPNSSTLTFTSAGNTYYWVAYYNGDGINLAGHSGCAAEPVTINKVTPTLTTTDSPTTSIIVGTTATVSDSLTFGNLVTGVYPASTSTVTFTLYSGTTCTNAVSGVTATVNPSGTSATVSSGNLSFSPTATGTYTWGVSFSGDSNYNSVPQQCGNVSANETETLTVVAASPTLVTQIHLDDKVTISGGDNPTGTVTFKLYNTLDCSGSVVAEFDNVSIVSGVASTLGVTPNSGSSWVPTSGNYSWLATYSGDSNNNTVTVGCNATNGDQETAGITYTP